MQIDHKPRENMNEKPAPIWIAFALLAFGLVLGFFHFLMIGFSQDFGSGFAIGAIIGGGMIFLLVRDARRLR